MPIRLCLAWFALHFSLILGVSFHETLWLVRHGLTLLPSPFKSEGQKDATVPAVVMGEAPTSSNPFRQAFATYTGIAGIDAGYGYFAPNVPGTYRLSFELLYADGTVERTLPRVHSFSAGLRIAGLLDQIGRTRSELLREHMVRMLAQSLWRAHPNVKKMRANLEEVSLPSVRDFEHGKKESLQLLYTYDFSLVRNRQGR